MFLLLQSTLQLYCGKLCDKVNCCHFLNSNSVLSVCILFCLQWCDQWCHNVPVSTGKVSYRLPGGMCSHNKVFYILYFFSICETVDLVSPSGQIWEELSHLLWDAGRSPIASEAGFLFTRSWDLLLSQPGRKSHVFWGFCINVEKHSKH